MSDMPRLPLFLLGQIVYTLAAFRAGIVNEGVAVARDRHAYGDYGDLSEDDCQRNADALVQGGRILSAYRAANGVKYWVITEHDRSHTTILLPSDY